MPQSKIYTEIEKGMDRKEKKKKKKKKREWILVIRMSSERKSIPQGENV